MLNKNKLKFLSGLILLLFSASFCSAAQDIVLIGPSGSGIPMNCYFQWNASPQEVEKYGINLHEADSPWIEILIKADEYKVDENTYALPALELASRGASLNYDTSYDWQIIAYNQVGTEVDSSPVWFFHTESPEEPPPPPPGGPIGLDNPLNQGSLWDAIDALINFLFVLSLAVAPILLIYAGFLLLIKAGDPEATTQAKKIIMWTMIGLSVVLFAKGVPSVVMGVLGR
jgi:hypothetical protein